MALVAPATSPTVAITRALKRAGLQQGKGKDFQVKGRYRNGERQFTYVRVYGTSAEAVVAERADDIERWTAESGFPFRVSVLYMGQHPVTDVHNGPRPRIRQEAPAAPAVEEPAVQEPAEEAAPAPAVEEPAVQEPAEEAAPAPAVEEPAVQEPAAPAPVMEAHQEAPSCPPGLYVVNLPSTRYRDWYGVECGRCVPGVRQGLPGEWDDRGDALVAARSHYELEHRSADEALTPAELEELERWSLSTAQLRVMGWAHRGHVQEFEDGVWALDVSPDRADVNKRVARPRISGLWAAGLVGVYGLSCGGRQFVITDTGRRLLRLYFLAERQGHALEGTRDARLPVLPGRERGYPFLVEGRYFVGEERPEAAAEETAPAAEETAVQEPAAPVAEEPAPSPSVEEEPAPVVPTWRQERQARALGWTARHAEVVRWAAAGELVMDGPDDLRRVTAPGRAGRRVAAALLRPLTAAAFLTLGELDDAGRHRVELTEDGRRALEVWDLVSPTPAVVSRKQEARHQLRPLLGGQEARRRSAEFEADLKRRAAEREAWYAEFEIRRAAEELEERCADAWAAVEGIRYRLGRKAPAGWVPTDEEVRLHGLAPEVVDHLRAKAARLAAEAAAADVQEPEEHATPAVQEAPEGPAGRAPELPAAPIRHAAPHHTRRTLTLQSHHVSIEVSGRPNGQGTEGTTRHDRHSDPDRRRRRYRHHPPRRQGHRRRKPPRPQRRGGPRAHGGPGDPGRYPALLPPQRPPGHERPPGVHRHRPVPHRPLLQLRPRPHRLLTAPAGRPTGARPPSPPTRRTPRVR